MSGIAEQLPPGINPYNSLQPMPAFPYRGSLPFSDLHAGAALHGLMQEGAPRTNSTAYKEQNKPRTLLATPPEGLPAMKQMKVGSFAYQQEPILKNNAENLGRRPSPGSQKSQSAFTSPVASLRQAVTFQPNTKQGSSDHSHPGAPRVKSLSQYKSEKTSAIKVQENSPVELKSGEVQPSLQSPVRLNIESLSESIIQQQFRCKQAVVPSLPISRRSLDAPSTNSNETSAYDFVLRHQHLQSEFGSDRKLRSAKEKQVLTQVESIHRNTEPKVFSRHDDGALQELVPKLITCEKLLQQVAPSSAATLRVFNSFQLLTLYFKLGDFHRVSRFCEQSALPTIDPLISQPPAPLVQNYILHIYSLLADSLMMLSEYKRACKMFYSLCKHYNNWKVPKKHKFEKAKIETLPHEFGVDEYIRTKASYAECLMNLGQVKHAVDKFENAKRAIENEVVFESPLLFINICNQLGNCYLGQASKSHSKKEHRSLLAKALDNFESSLCLINRMADQTMPVGVTSKVCLNIAMIQTAVGNDEEAIIMNQKSMEYMMEEDPKNTEGLKEQYVVLALSQQKNGQVADACASLEQALELQKAESGEFTAETAQYMTLLGHAYLKDEQFSKCISVIEHAAMILATLESRKQANSDGHLSNKLDEL